MANNEQASALWANTDPSVWLRNWSAAMSLVPQRVDQSINPGWFGTVFNINSGNSSAPQTEADVLQHHSYGRQLGRISEALEALLNARPKTAPTLPGAKDFLDMKAQIDQVKLDAAKVRIDALVKDLAALKKGRKADYEQLRVALLKALGT